MQMIIDSAHTSLTVRNKCFYVTNKKMSRQISPKRISSIAIMVNCNINTSAMRLAALHQIPLLIFDKYGGIHSRMWSPYFANISKLRKKQMLFSFSTEAQDYILTILNLKAKRQISLLKRWKITSKGKAERLQVLIGKITDAVSKFELITRSEDSIFRSKVMGYEGNISKLYLSGLRLILPDIFQFEKRSRRPARDKFNAGINYLYGMSYSIVEQGIFTRGLDPTMGILHADMPKKPTLAFDLIEPFRPIVDELFLQLIENKTVLSSYFLYKNEGVLISKEGRRTLILHFNEYLHKRIRLDGKVMRLKDHIFLASKDLEDFINKTILE